MIRWIYSLSAKNVPQVSRGAAGTINLPLQDQTLELSANYTDYGGPSRRASPLSGGAVIRLHPRTIQAESYTTNNGTQILNANEKPFLGAINHSHWTEYHRFRLEGCQKITFRYASAGNGATVTITANGKNIGAAFMKPTGNWNTWKEVSIPLANLPSGLVNLRLTFTNPGKQHLANIDWFRFE
jgi:hypothetical protein